MGTELAEGWRSNCCPEPRRSLVARRFGPRKAAGDSGGRAVEGEGTGDSFDLDVAGGAGWGAKPRVLRPPGPFGGRGPDGTSCGGPFKRPNDDSVGPCTLRSRFCLPRLGPVGATSAGGGLRDCVSRGGSTAASLVAFVLDSGGPRSSLVSLSRLVSLGGPIKSLPLPLPGTVSSLIKARRAGFTWGWS